MDNAYVGEIRAVPLNFVPQGWLLCDGSIVSITQYQVLYSIIGNLYGPVTSNSFKLPDLRSRTIIGIDPGNVNLMAPGTIGGTAQESISINQMGTHNHPINANKHTTAQMTLGTNVPSENVFLSNMLATTPDGKKPGLYAYSTNGTTIENIALVGTSGNVTPAPHDNMMPYMLFRYCICYFGTYPSKN